MLETLDNQLIVSPTSEIESLIGLAISDLDSPNSKRSYESSLRDFLSWWQDRGKPQFCKAEVLKYKESMKRRGLSASTINLAICAVHKLAAEAQDNNLIDPVIASGIQRAKGVKSRGVRIGNWLEKDQAQKLLDAPDRSTLEGKRDFAVLCLLLGGWLRRAELVSLDVSHIQRRENRWMICDLVGKGNKTRSVCLPDWAAEAVQEWMRAAGITSGAIFRGFTSRHKTRVFDHRMTSEIVRSIVRKYAAICGFDELRPHDLRRTSARLAFKGGAAIDQVSVTLGHASLLTTQRYLRVDLDLESPACDFLGLEVKP
jgi:site-specific recombinase XerD